MSCTSWSPASNITFTSGIYHVDAGWLADLIEDPEPLWGCDDARIVPAAVGEFEVECTASGEALYELGLRDGDIPVSLNGDPLGTSVEAFEAFATYLNQETEYTLVVKRSGVPTTLLYEVD